MKTRLFLFLLFIFPFIHMQAQTYSTPTNFDIRLKNSKKVELNWDLSQGDSLPVSYRLKRNGETVDSLSGYSVAYVDSLSTDGKYTYQLTAFYGDNMSLEAEETPEALIGYALPIDFNYAISELFNVNLMWNLSEGEIYPVGYQLFRNEELIVELSGYEVNSYIDLLLRDGTYNYKLMAVYEDDQTAFAENEPVVELVIEYGLPVNFSSILREENTVLFTWGVTNEENMPILFRLLRNEIPIASIASNEFMYIDSNIKAGTSTYRLLADYENDTSITADEDIVITVDYAIPSQFTYSIKNGNNVILDWMNLKNGIYPTSYQVMRNDEMIAEIAGESFSYADTNLSNGNYSYELIVYYGNDTNLTLALDSVVHITQTYAFPVNFKYVVDNYDVFLSWYLPLEGILPFMYKLVRNGDTIAEFSVDSISYLDSGLEVGVYTYNLLSYYAGDTVIVTKCDTINMEALYVIPEYLTYTIINGNNVILSWSVTGKGILPESYQIERNSSIIDSISGAESMYIDTGLSLGNYSYRLIIYYGTDTILIIEDTNSITIEAIGGNVVYAVPRNFAYEIENTNNVILIWDVLDRGESMRPVYYRIERNDSVIAEISEDSIRIFLYLDTHLIPDEYVYNLTAYYEDSTSISVDEGLSLTIDTSGVGILIDEDEVYVEQLIDSGSTYYSPPVNLKDTVEGNSVVLSWDPPAGGITPVSYRIERNNTVLIEVSGSTLTFSDSDLEIGTYVYRISAIYNDDKIYPSWGARIATIQSCD